MVAPRGRANITIYEPERGPQADNASKWKDEYCDLIKEMAQKGMFPEEWCAHIGISMPTFYNWAKRRPEFEDAVKVSWVILNAVWTDKLRRSINDPLVKPTILIEVMRKRFPETWGENARNTETTFRQHMLGDDEAEVAPERVSRMDDEEIARKIALLEQRRQAED
jgi:hypothetical protein